LPQRQLSEYSYQGTVFPTAATEPDPNADNVTRTIWMVDALRKPKFGVLDVRQMVRLSGYCK
jgi:hypothetical protein